MLTHLSLFSGIGGLDLAAEAAGFVTVGQCEWADYPTKVLEKHWPDVQRWRDIHGLSADDFVRRTGHKTVTVISGGFPCQPHSVAGKRKASCDERDLWPEMRRVICEIKPGWVVAENVPGLLSSEDGRFFAGVLRDFAEMGFDVGWGITSAAAVGAVHRRERMAIVAHANGVRLPWGAHSASSNKIRQDGAQQLQGFLQTSFRANIPGRHTDGKNNGFSDRVDRVKALGNAVVPQSFYPIFKAIHDIEVEEDNAVHT